MCTILHNTATCYIVLPLTATQERAVQRGRPLWNDVADTCCSTLQHTATRCNALQRAATRCIASHRTAPRCEAVQRTATHCNALQRSALHGNALQHTATHCTALLQSTQHTATRYIALQHTTTQAHLEPHVLPCESKRNQTQPPLSHTNIMTIRWY